MNKYNIHYQVQGNITIEAENEEQAYKNFFDEVGFSTDELYENLNSQFMPMLIRKVEE